MCITEEAGEGLHVGDPDRAKGFGKHLESKPADKIILHLYLSACVFSPDFQIERKIALKKIKTTSILISGARAIN